MKYPKFKNFDFDETRHIIRIPNAGHKKRKECEFAEIKRDVLLKLCLIKSCNDLYLVYFMAPSDEVFDAVVDRMDQLVKQWEASEDVLAQTTTDAVDEEFEDADPHVDMTEFPSDGSTLDLLFFLALYPVRLIMQWTLPDVRTLDSNGNPTATLGKAYLAIVMCLVWLIVGSYAMVSSLEHLAALMDIPDAVVGVTVSAAGTSLPNYVASKVAAEKGFGVSLTCIWLVWQTTCFQV